jgi:hypothetical protein
MIRMQRLSEGMVIEASIIARLLRLRILTVDASIVLLPAGARPAGGEAATPLPDPWNGRTTARGRLSDAIRSIDHAEQGLARAVAASRG